MTYQNITVLGNVGRDPELRYTQNATAVCDFPIATNRRWTDSNGQQQEQTTWWRVTCWRNTAEIAAKYVKKGRQVLVVASQVEASAYIAKDGEPRASLEITADNITLVGSRSDSAPEPNTQTSTNDVPF